MPRKKLNCFSYRIPPTWGSFCWSLQRRELCLILLKLVWVLQVILSLESRLSLGLRWLLCRWGHGWFFCQFLWTAVVVVLNRLGCHRGPRLYSSAHPKCLLAGRVWGSTQMLPSFLGEQRLTGKFLHTNSCCGHKITFFQIKYNRTPTAISEMWLCWALLL